MHLRSYATRVVLNLWRIYLSVLSLLILSGMALTFNPDQDLPRIFHDPVSLFAAVLKNFVWIGFQIGTLWILWFARK